MAFYPSCQSSHLWSMFPACFDDGQLPGMDIRSSATCLAIGLDSPARSLCRRASVTLAKGLGTLTPMKSLDDGVG